MRKNIFLMVCCFSIAPAFVCAEPSTNDLSQACYRQFRALSEPFWKFTDERFGVA